MIVENYDPNIIKLTKENPTKVLVLGSTGSGKSALCNTLINDQSHTTFIESEKITSFTAKTNSRKVQWFDSSGEFILIDTPGMNDSESKDTEHISSLVDHLKQEIVVLNAFVIVINAQNPRLDDSMKSMLKLFAEMFTLDFLNQTLIVFTRWPFDEKEILRREQNGDSEENKTAEINQKISELLIKDKDGLGFGRSGLNIPCFFICNSYNRSEIAKRSSKEELHLFVKTLKRIKKTILSFPIYFCDKIIKIQTEKDMLKCKLKEQMKKNLAHKMSRGGCMKCDCLQYYYSNEEFKKYATATIAATTSSGGLFGGFAGLMTGVGLGSVVSSAMYFNLHVCYCSHEKKDHYNPDLKNQYDLDCLIEFDEVLNSSTNNKNKLLN